MRVSPRTRRGILSAALLVVFGLLMMPRTALAGSVTVVWDPNTEPDLAGYVVKYGTQPGVYQHAVDVGNVTSWQSPDLPDGRYYYFVVHAYNTAGLTSDPSSEVKFFLDLPYGVPIISTVSPATGTTAGGTLVTITGAGFATGASVTFGGIPATSVVVVNANTIQAVTPPRGAPGSIDVRVTNPGGQQGVLVNGFTYAAPSPAPSVLTVTPSSGPTAGGTRITIVGANFVNGATVRVGGKAATAVQFVNSSTLAATTPSGSAGAAEVRVVNPDGQQAAKAGAFTYTQASSLALYEVDPASGPTLGGTHVTLTGAFFAAGMRVSFGGVEASGVTVVSPTRATAITPPHAAGPVAVTVTVGSTSVVVPSAFTYVGQDPSVDTDGDGLPDVWESQFGLDPNSAAGDDGAAGDPDADGAANSVEYQDGTHPRGFYKRYFAEGVSSSFFTTQFALLNPNVETASVLLRFMKDQARAERQAMTLAPLSRATFNTRSLTALANHSFSTLVESDRLIVADRTVSWDDSGYGGHAETGIEAPSTIWYLAEGATHSGFDLYYLIQNPEDTAASVEVTYMLPSGSPIVKTYSVKAKSRYTIWVDVEHPRLGDADISAVVRSLNGVPIVVERAMYMNTGGKFFGAGHNSAAVTAPATRWFLAEGATGSMFDLYVLIANPTNQAASLKVTYLLPGGATVVKTYGVGATRRFTIWVNQEDPALADTSVSTIVESTNGVPVIVERAMWWQGGYRRWVESHNSPGTTTTATRWALAEGEEGGAQNRRTYILLANTSATAGSAKVTLHFEDQTSAERTYALAPSSRFTIDVTTDFPEARNRRFGTVIESLGPNPAELVVERAMYWDAGGVWWAAGTNAIGTRLPSVP